MSVSCCLDGCGGGSGGAIFGIGCGVRTGIICGVLVMVDWGPWEKVGPAWLLFYPINFFDRDSVGRTGSSCCAEVRGGPHFYDQTCSSGSTNLGCGILHRGEHCYALAFGRGTGGILDGSIPLSSSSILSRDGGYIPMYRGIHVLICRYGDYLCHRRCFLCVLWWRLTLGGWR